MPEQLAGSLPERLLRKPAVQCSDVGAKRFGVGRVGLLDLSPSLDSLLPQALGSVVAAFILSPRCRRRVAAHADLLDKRVQNAADLLDRVSLRLGKRGLGNLQSAALDPANGLLEALDRAAHILPEFVPSQASLSDGQPSCQQQRCLLGLELPSVELRQGLSCDLYGRSVVSQAEPALHALRGLRSAQEDRGDVLVCPGPKRLDLSLIQGFDIPGTCEQVSQGEHVVGQTGPLRCLARSRCLSAHRLCLLQEMAGL